MLEAVTPLLPRFGITRVANITGLDRVGIPIFQAIRPNSRSLSVSQGKGVDADASRVSAIMESIETYHAERVHLPLRLAPHRELALEGAVAPSDLPLSRDSTYRPGHPVLWTSAVEIVAGIEGWVPYEMVHANATLPLVPGSGQFVRSTNGLASGSDATEAVLHGLCEIIERDALALFDALSGAAQEALRIDLRTVRDPTCTTLLGKLHDAGLSASCWNVTTDIRVPALLVILSDDASDGLLHLAPATLGSGCHPRAATALGRALTEAAQGRLGLIAGSREDLSRQHYERLQSTGALATARAHAAAPAHCSFDDLPSFTAETVGADLAHVLSCLSRAGFDRAFTVDLTDGDFPFTVVRTLVPGLEGPSGSPHYRPGPRAVRVLGAR
jgi:ribosomal protein S12 methylthiotransferase accessory factor